MPSAPQTNPIELAKRKAKALDALDLMGSIVGRRIYDPARETLVLRVGFWITQEWATVDEICAACESMTTPAALAKIRGEWDMNADLAAAVERVQFERQVAAERKAAEDRKAAERAEAERWRQETERWKKNGDAEGNRALVLKLLAGVGTQVGRGRPTTPRAQRGDETETESEGQADRGETAEQAAQETDGRESK